MSEVWFIGKLIDFRDKKIQIVYQVKYERDANKYYDEFDILGSGNERMFKEKDMSKDCDKCYYKENIDQGEWEVGCLL